MKNWIGTHGIAHLVSYIPLLPFRLCQSIGQFIWKSSKHFDSYTTVVRSHCSLSLLACRFAILRKSKTSRGYKREDLLSHVKVAYLCTDHQLETTVVSERKKEQIGTPRWCGGWNCEGQPSEKRTVLSKLGSRYERKVRMPVWWSKSEKPPYAPPETLTRSQSQVVPRSLLMTKLLPDSSYPASL